MTAPAPVPGFPTGIPPAPATPQDRATAVLAACSAATTQATWSSAMQDAIGSGQLAVSCRAVEAACSAGEHSPEMGCPPDTARHRWHAPLTLARRLRYLAEYRGWER